MDKIAAHELQTGEYFYSLSARVLYEDKAIGETAPNKGEKTEDLCMCMRMCMCTCTTLYYKSFLPIPTLLPTLTLTLTQPAILTLTCKTYTNSTNPTYRNEIPDLGFYTHQVTPYHSRAVRDTTPYCRSAL